MTDDLLQLLYDMFIVNDKSRFVYCWDNDQRDLLHKFSWRKGEWQHTSYNTTPEHCNCPSFAKNHDTCKHQRMLTNSYEGDGCYVFEFEYVLQTLAERFSNNASFSVDSGLFCSKVELNVSNWPWPKSFFMFQRSMGIGSCGIYTIRKV